MNFLIHFTKISLSEWQRIFKSEHVDFSVYLHIGSLSQNIKTNNISLRKCKRENYSNLYKGLEKLWSCPRKLPNEQLEKKKIESSTDCICQWRERKTEKKKEKKTRTGQLHRVE